MKSINYANYKLVIEDDGKVAVLKDSTPVANTSQCMKEIADSISFNYEPKWTTRQMGAKLFKALSESSMSTQEEVQNSQVPVNSETYVASESYVAKDCDSSYKKLDERFTNILKRSNIILEAYKALNKKVNNLQSELSQKSDEISSMSEKNEELKAQINGLESELSGKKAKISSLVDEYNDLVDNYNDLEGKYQKLCHDYVKMDLEHDKLKESYDDIRENNEKLQKSSSENSSDQKKPDKNPDVRVRFDFKIKGILGDQRVTRYVTMKSDEYKALLKGTDSKRKNYVINHRDRFDLGIVQYCNAENLTGVTVELDD